MAEKLPRHVSNERICDKPLGFIAALLVHAGLLFALYTVFQWRTDAETFYAELWAPEEVSGTAAQRGVAEPTPPEEEKLPEPEPPKAIEQQKADIAIEEKKRKDAEKKRAEEEAKKRAEAERLQKRQRELEKKRIAEEKRKREELRQKELARITGATPAAPGQRVGSVLGDKNALEQNLTGKLDANYSARVISYIRPRITYSVPSSLKRGDHRAIYLLRLLPSGEVVNVQKHQPSGLPAYDAAVERAIHQCRTFPKPLNGAPVPRELQLIFDPVAND